MSRMKRKNDSFKIKDLIPEMLEENKLQKGMNQIQVKEAWEEVMGQGVMSYTDQVYLKNQIIFVKLNSSTLREELKYGKEKILDMLQNRLKTVKLKAVKLI